MRPTLNTIVQRRSLWDDLKLVGPNFMLPWLVLGDFNSVLSSDEKRGGLHVKNYETRDFTDCVATLDLLDLQYSGCYFTWNSPKVCSKLDRALVDNLWISSNMEGFAEFLTPSCTSDHAACIVTMFEKHRRKKMRPFKFLNMWTLCDDFDDIVRDKWVFHGHGTSRYRLKHLFNALKKPLQQLNNKHFSNISCRANEAKVNLDKLQMQMLNTGVMADSYRHVRRKTEMLLEAERLFIAQKTKIKYLKEGDRQGRI